MSPRTRRSVSAWSTSSAHAPRRRRSRRCGGRPPRACRPGGTATVVAAAHRTARCARTQSTRVRERTTTRSLRLHPQPGEPGREGLDEGAGVLPRHVLPGLTPRAAHRVAEGEVAGRGDRPLAEQARERGRSQRWSPSPPRPRAAPSCPPARPSDRIVSRPGASSRTCRRRGRAGCRPARSGCASSGRSTPGRAPRRRPT